MHDYQEIERQRRSIRLVVYDGAASGGSVGVGDTFLAPFAIALGAGAAQVGLLSSLPILMGALIQVMVPEAIQRGTRRRPLYTWAGLITALLWIPIILIPFLMKEGAVDAVIVLVLLSALANGVSIPALASTLADLIPERMRGRMVGARNRLIGLAGVVGMIGGGLLLKELGGDGILIGFAVLFGLAMLLRLISTGLLSRVWEPPLEVPQDSAFSLLEFLQRMPFNNFGRFTILAAVMTFSTFVAAPYFVLYMLHDLRMSYPIYVLLILASSLASLFALPIWGRWADRYGNLWVIKVTGWLIPLAPIVWLVSENFWYLVLIQVFAGIVWAGYNLSMANYISDAVTPARRPRCVAYYNLLNGLATFLGSALGGFLATHLPPMPWSPWPLLTLFLVSGIARAITAIGFSALWEVRPVSPMVPGELFASLGGLWPQRGPMIRFVDMFRYRPSDPELAEKQNGFTRWLNTPLWRDPRE